MLSSSIPFPPPSGVLTVQQLVALYLALEGPDLAPSSLKQKRYTLAAFARQFGDWPWNALHKSDLKAWIRNNPHWTSDETRRNQLRIVKRVFAWAEDDQRIGHNPFGKLSWPAGPSRRSMTDPEFRALSRAFCAMFRRVLLFLRETGCRPCELATLEWPMIDWQACIIVQSKHKTARRTGKARTIYLSALAVRLLRWLQRQRTLYPDFESSFVFVNARGRPWRSEALSQRIQRVRDRLGIPKDCKLYGLRHALGNRSQAAGNDIRDTADLLGHTSIRTTERHYLHAAERRESLLIALERARG